MQKTGAQIVAECLLEQGVDTVFGYPGGQIIDVYDALYEYSDQITHILTAHEQGASHAADGYARSTGKTGVVIATSGPGATNLVTGLATAHMDSVPIVAITGNVSLPLLGKDSFQEVDIYGVTGPITKYNFIVKDVKDLAKTIRQAFYIAKSGRPGPVLVDVLKNVQMSSCEFEREEPREVVPDVLNITREDLSKAAELISYSKKPMIFAGGGVISANASQALKIFADKIGAPVALSMMGLGACPADDPHFTGMLGMHGTKVSSLAVSHCDLFIVAGARLSDRVIGKSNEFAAHAKILHLDVDPAEINKNIRTDASVIGDLDATLTKLSEIIEKQDHAQWLKQIEEWKEEFPPVKEWKGDITPYHLISKVAERLPKDSLIVTDVGQHQIWTAQHYPIHQPRTFISSGGLGTMGFGMGAAIGSKIANPDKKVVLFTGDGSFHMNCNELSTAASYGVDITVIILNNGVLGMVRQWQKLMYDKHYSQTTLNRKTDYVKLTEAFGGTGFRVTSKEDLESILDQALGVKGPVVVEVPIDKDVNVLPMVPPGKAYNQQVMSIDL